MDRLPVNVLITIFSYLSPTQLLRTERVCWRWQRVIQELYWNKLDFITEETIGYPQGDYVTNFIRLASRLVRVTQFVDPFLLPVLHSSNLAQYRSSHEFDGRLSMAVMELVKKLSIDSLFPLDGIRYIVNAKLNLQLDVTKSMVETVLRVTVQGVVNQSRLNVFSSLRINYLFVHSSHADPFVVRWRNQEVPLPVQMTKTTRLVVGCLVIRLLWNGWEDREPIDQAMKSIQYLSMFSHLESVEIDRVHLMIDPYVAGGEMSFEIDLEFHEKRRHFGVVELQCLLTTLCQTGASIRDFEMARCIEKWCQDGRLKRADLHVGSFFFARMEELLNNGSYDCGFHVDPFGVILAQVLPSYVDTLHLTYERDQIADNLLIALKVSGILGRLRELSITFAYEMWYSDLVLLWNEEIATFQVKSIVRTICDSLRSLECLTLRFTAGSPMCCKDEFRKFFVPNGPLPRLVNLECVGLPILPFVVSVVSQASDLCRLSVGCQPFECDAWGLKWISLLLDRVAACSRLTFLQISVDSEEHLSSVAGRRHPAAESQVTAQLQQQHHDTLEVNTLLIDIEAKLQTLRQRSSLLHLVVSITSRQYSFIINKELNWNNVD